MIVTTLAELHQSFADFVQEKVPPATSDSRYTQRTRWFNRGREDLAKRWFLKSLLKQGTLAIVAGTPTYTLPEDFEKPNGLYALVSSDGTLVYTDPYQKQVVVSIGRDFSTGRYTLTFTPTPATSDNAPYWYFATPPLMTGESDPVLLDGEAVLYYGLKQHYFINGPLDKYQEVRDEYENLVDELLKANEIPPPGALLAMRNLTKSRYGTTSEKAFYTPTGRRST